MKTLALAWTAALLLAAGPAAADLQDELRSVQHDWAVATYETPEGDARVEAFAGLAERAAVVSEGYPGRAEPLVWEGIVLSTYAGAKGGLGALGLAKQSRQKLEAAEAIDPDCLDGSIYTSLGALYYKLPGWPLSFGSDDRARTYLDKALSLNPGGIDPNFFYGEFLAEQGEAARAREYLQRALRASDRPNRPLADAGRRAEAQALLDKL